MDHPAENIGSNESSRIRFGESFSPFPEALNEKRVNHERSFNLENGSVLVIRLSKLPEIFSSLNLPKGRRLWARIVPGENLDDLGKEKLIRGTIIQITEPVTNAIYQSRPDPSQTNLYFDFNSFRTTIDPNETRRFDNETLNPYLIDLDKVTGLKVLVRDIGIQRKMI